MTAEGWLAMSERAWQHGCAATDQGRLAEARFWLGRWRLAAYYARHPPG